MDDAVGERERSVQRILRPGDHRVPMFCLLGQKSFRPACPVAKKVYRSVAHDVVDDCLGAALDAVNC